MNYQNYLQAILQGVSAVTRNSAALTKKLALWFAVYAFLTWLLQTYQQSLVIQIVGGILAFLIFIIVSVATHRTIILGEEVTPFFGVRSIGVREWQFFLAFFEAVFYSLPGAIFIFIPYVGEYVAMTVGAYIVSRISLIFPSIAIDVPMSSRASWQATGNRQLMMFTVVFLFSAFLTLLERGFSKFGVPALIVDLFSLITVVFLVGALSEAYKTIMADLANEIS